MLNRNHIQLNLIVVATYRALQVHRPAFTFQIVTTESTSVLCFVLSLYIILYRVEELHMQGDEG